MSANLREQWGSNDMFPHSTHVRCSWWIKMPFNASALQIPSSAILIQDHNSLMKFTGCIPFAVALVCLTDSPDLPPAALGLERLRISTAAGSVASLPREALTFERLWTSPTASATGGFVASLSSLSPSPQVGSEWLLNDYGRLWMTVDSPSSGICDTGGWSRLCLMMMAYLVNRQQTLPLLASSAHPSFWASLPHRVFHLRLTASGICFCLCHHYDPSVCRKVSDSEDSLGWPPVFSSCGPWQRLKSVVWNGTFSACFPNRSFGQTELLRMLSAVD